MHPLSATPHYPDKIYSQPNICMISRLTYVSLIVVLVFTVCIIHEFTFILNYTTYATTSTSVENHFTFRYRNMTRERLSDKDDWRKISDDLYVYSAYWDRRVNNESFIRIIGGVKLTSNTSTLNSTKCLLKYNNSSQMVEADTNYEILVGHHNKESRAVYINCIQNSDEIATHVTIAPVDWNDTWTLQLSWVKIQFPQYNLLFTDLGICVRPMFNYTDVFRVSEFIAYYEALGVNHFTFYIYAVSEDIIEYFHALNKENYSIEVLPWSLPSTLDSMWAVGQMASINDCIYRNMGKVEYLVIADLDEFITPRHVMKLKEVLKHQDIPGKNAASFVFRSCVFCAEYPRDILPPVILPFKTQSDIRRENYIYPYLVRSKYIVKPSKVEVAAVHHAWRLISGWEERFVPISQAIVHHYRAELCLSQKKTLEKGEIDVKSRKYLNHLMRSKAVSVWKKHFYKRY